MKSPIHDERISSFLDDALPETERRAFESELAHDAELQQHVAELRQLRQDVATLPRYTVTQGFAQRVVKAALAAQANQNAQLEPAKSTKPVKPKTIFRLAVGTLAIAASAAIIMASLPWLRPDIAPVKLTQNEPVKAPANKALEIVWSSLPSDGEALVLRIRSPKDLAAGQVLREAFAQQGIEKRRPADSSTAAAAVGKAYRDHLKAASGTDRTGSTPAADALFLEISREELEMALSQLTQPTQNVTFIPEQRLAVTKPRQVPDSIEPKAVGEDAPQVGSQANSAEFVQEINPSLFRLPKSQVGPAHAIVPAPTSTPTGKVRVLILFEHAE